MSKKSQEHKGASRRAGAFPLGGACDHAVHTVAGDLDNSARLGWAARFFFF